MSHFDDETRIAPTGEGTWTAEISDEWSIGPVSYTHLTLPTSTEV